MLRFPLNFFFCFTLFISLFWRSPTHLDCTLRRRYSAQVTAISIYFCTLPCTPPFALFLQRDAHTITIIFAHFYWTAHTHARTNTNGLHWWRWSYGIFPLLAPIFATFGRYFGSSFDSWLWRLISLPLSNRNRAQTFTPYITHTHTQGMWNFPLFSRGKIANSRTFHSSASSVFSLPQSK